MNLPFLEKSLHDAPHVALCFPTQKASLFGTDLDSLLSVFNPRCPCGRSCLLQAVQKGRARAEVLLEPAAWCCSPCSWALGSWASALICGNDLCKWWCRAADALGARAVTLLWQRENIGIRGCSTLWDFPLVRTVSLRPKVVLSPLVPWNAVIQPAPKLLVLSAFLILNREVWDIQVLWGDPYWFL